MGSILCVGTAMIDTVLSSKEPIVVGKCNKVTRYTCDGGSIRNVAHNLRLFENDVFFWAKFGNDIEGLELISRQEALGMDVHSTIVDANTPHFYQYTTENGPFLASTITDDFDFNSRDLFPTFLLSGQTYGITDQSDPQFLESLVNRTPKIQWIALGFLPPKELLPRFFAVFANRVEAIYASSSVDAFLSSTIDLPLAVVTMDKEGILYQEKKVVRRIPAPVIGPGNDVGMGDALIAGFIHAYLAGLSLELSLYFGVNCARKTSDVLTPVNTQLTDLLGPHV